MFMSAEEMTMTESPSVNREEPPAMAVVPLWETAAIRTPGLNLRSCSGVSRCWEPGPMMNSAAYTRPPATDCTVMAESPLVSRMERT